LQLRAVSSPIHAARCAKRDATSVDVQLTPTPASGAQFPFSRFFGLWLLDDVAGRYLEPATRATPRLA
jgi:hypothetical protein